MALQIWLPLTGHLENQGLSDITVTNNGATLDSNGKLGGCYNFSGTSYLYENNYDWSNFNTSEFSLCCWYKEPSPVAGGNSQMICIGTSDGWNNIRIGLLRRVSNGYPMFSVSDGSSAVQYGCTASSFSLDTWNHIACTYKNGLMSMYINGVLDKTSTTTIVPALNSYQHLGIGGASNGREKLTGYLNDVRVYDHALSAKEVKELSKGLVAHYKLDDIYSTDNLIINGYGELGAENWTKNTISTTEIPSSLDSNIKASFYDLNVTQKYIPISHASTYTLSFYIKAKSDTQATYPSIMPYDVDGHFIANFMCSVGFSNAYKTTLSQPLHKGDTVIHATDLSAWTTANNYYIHVAVFGYKDSTGYVYPDMQYTQDSPSFGTLTDKSNIDKTNNTITLLAPFTGEDRPAGTVICQATEGAGYYYPFGYFQPSEISDWTYKTTQLDVNSARLRFAKYIQFGAYWYAYYAGIKLVDNTVGTNIVYDCSGYNYHGTKTGDLTVSSDTSRYSLSTHFNGTSYSYLTSISPEIVSMSLWVKWDSIPSGQSVVFMDYKSRIGFGLMSTGILCGSVSGSYYTFSKSSIVANTWYHFVIVSPSGATNTARKLYINGVEQTATSNTSNWSYGIDQLQIGKRSSTSDGFVGKISDFRAYATVLSADDILELYHTSASIDKDGNFYAYELKEVE